MNKQALLEQFTKWNVDGESEKIVAAVISLPDDVLDADIMFALADAYLKIEEPKKAVAVLEGLRKTEEETYKWQYMMGHALLVTANEDEECSDDEELRNNILERARICFARGMNMNPPAPYLQEADMIMSRLDRMLGIVDEDEDDSDDFDDYNDYSDAEPPSDGDLELYDEDEAIAVEEHINEYFGEFPTVFHEIASQDIHVDVAVIPPTEERNYYTLITMGMGAHQMNIPDDADEDLARAELVICLPPNWKVGENSDRWFWPIGMIKSLAHLPIDCDTWLGWGHSVDNKNSFAENTALCGSLLIYPEGVEEGAEKCTLPNGDVVNFYQVIPIYREEMDFKVANGTTELLEKLMESSNHIVNIDRPNVCEDFYYTNFRFDVVQRHSSKVIKNRFPLDPICGCNHIAIFVRWCIEHNLMEPGFYEQCPEVAENVISGKDTDVRRFVIDVMGGRLEMYHFTYVGANFLKNYYCNDFDGKFSYCSDVDDYAESYFGTEKYNCEEFKDEAYLFVPFDEQYYQGMSKYIQRAYDDYFKYFSNVKKLQSDEILKGISAKLGFEAQTVTPDSDLFKRIKSGLPKRSDSKTDIPMLVFNFDLCDTTERAEKALLDGLIPFLVTYSLVTLPYRDPMGWVKDRFVETDDRLQIPDTYGKIFEMYGNYPWLLTFDNESDGKFTLFIRDGDGSVVRYDSKDDIQAD